MHVHLYVPCIKTYSQANYTVGQYVFFIYMYVCHVIRFSGERRTRSRNAQPEANVTSRTASRNTSQSQLSKDAAVVGTSKTTANTCRTARVEWLL